ncbi:hypothetical protein ACIGQE_20445 [Streptomyces sp. NPDC053429]|uniref:hypothetical protein n=1 Tax=Streptomyces sp. NPDC053429 TaxID=3365702 RepID=UPI0037CFE925
MPTLETLPRFAPDLRHPVLEHRAVAVGVQDAFDDNVGAVVQGVAGGEAIRPTVRSPGPGRSRSREHDPAQVFLATIARLRPKLLAQAGRVGRPA